MPMKTVASLILLVAAGVFAYTELTARLVSLETSRELFENDLLKKKAIKKVIKGLGKAVKAHTKQAKMLKGAINGGSKKGNGKKA